MDAVSRKEFWEMLKRLQSAGISMLVSTAYMDEAGLCDRVALIDQGNILEIGRPHQMEQEFPKQINAVRTDHCGCDSETGCWTTGSATSPRSWRRLKMTART